MSMLQYNQAPLPSGTTKIIVFDTNAYRVLTYGLSLEESRSKTLLLRQAEQKAGIFALANPFVIWELVGHLGDKSDPAYHYCLNALVSLGDHTWSPFIEKGGICLFADAESTVCLELFGTVPPGAAINVENLSKLAAHVRKHAPDLSQPEAINNLKVFSDELAKKETDWLAEMQKVLNDCDPKLAQEWVGGNTDKDVRKKLRDYFVSQSFMDAWAAVTVIRHADMVGIKLTNKEIIEKSEVVKKVFPVPFHLMSALLNKFPSPRPMNLTSAKQKRQNFMWDAAICFSIGEFHEIDGAPMLLVTGDKAIKKASIDAQCSNLVVTLEDYLKNVGFP